MIGLAYGKKTLVDRLVVQLTAETSSFRRGLLNVEKSLSRTGQSIVNFGRTVHRAILIKLTAIAVSSLKLAADYEMAMNRVRAVTRATEQDMAQLEETAKFLGRTTARTARQVAQGMETLGLAGFSVQEIDDSIRAITSLSVIAQQDMAISAQNAANLMRQFGIEAKDLGLAIDSLAVTATTSNQTVEDLVNGLKFAGPMAHMAGVSFQETSAMMGILANNGIRAGIAGRALRMQLLKLVAPTKGAREEMRRLGIEVADHDGNLYSMDQILTNVNKGIEGLGDAHRMASLAVIFGTRAVGPMNILLREQATILENGENAFIDYTNQIINSTGRAAEMEEILLRGLPGAIILFKSAMEGALLTIRELFDTDVENIIRGITRMLNKFSDMEKGRSVIIDYIRDFNKLSEDVGVATGFIRNKIDDVIKTIFRFDNATETVINKVKDAFNGLIDILENRFGFIIRGDLTHGAIADFMLLSLAIGPIIMIFGKLVMMLGSLVGLFSVLGKTITIFSVKLFSVLGAKPIIMFMALGAALKLLYERFVKLSEGSSYILDFITDFEKLKNAGTFVINYIIDRFNKLMDVMESAGGFLSPIFEPILNSFKKLMAYIEEKFGVTFPKLTQGLVIDIGIISAAVVGLTLVVGKLVGGLFGLKYIAMGIGGKFVSLFGFLTVSFLKIKALSILIAGSFGVVFGKMISLIFTGFTGVLKLLGTLTLAPLVKVVTAASGAIKVALLAVFGVVGTAVLKVLGVFKLFGGVLLTLLKPLSGVFGFLGKAVLTLIKPFTALIGLFKPVLGMFAGLGKVLLPILKPLLSITKLLGPLGLVLKAVGVGLLVLAKPILIVLGVILVLGIALAAIVGKFDLIKSTAIEAFSPLIGIGSQIWGALKELWESLKGLGISIFNLFKNFGKGSKDATDSIATTIIWLSTVIMRIIGSTVRIVGMLLIPIIQTIKVVVDILRYAIVRLEPTIQFVVKALLVLFGVILIAVEFLLEKLAGLIEWVVKHFPILLETIKVLVKGVINFIAAIFEFVIDIVMAIVKLFQDIFDPNTSFWQALLNFFTTLWVAVKDLFTGLIDAIVALFTGLFSDGGPLDFIATFFVNLVKTIKDIFIGVINFLIDGINSFIVDNLNSFSVEVFGKTLGFNIPKIPNIPGAATGAFVKRRPGGSPFIVGEGKEDEIISPMSALRDLLREAIYHTHRDMNKIFASELISATAIKHMTPMGIQVQRTERGQSSGVNITNNNTFAIHGDIERQVKEALRRQENESRFRLRGVRS